MSFLSEQQQSSTPLNDALVAGLDNIRYGQTLTFSPYVRVTLPLDGFVFWVSYGLVSADILASLGLPAEAPSDLQVNCSVHMSTETEQNEDESLDLSRIIITSESEVRPFHDTDVNLLWLSSFSGVRFSIGSRTGYYEQANLHHYKGSTIYPVMMSQIIDSADQLQLDNVILSNSTPLWLSIVNDLAKYPWAPGFDFKLYPRYLLPDNQVPPYGVVMPVEGSQKALSAGPIFSDTMSRDAYVRESVDIILYGCNNKAAADFLDTMLLIALNKPYFGINNSPVIADESRPQSEINVLAQKKRISFEVNYYQSQARDMAVRLITQCVPTFTVEL